PAPPPRSARALPRVARGEPGPQTCARRGRLQARRRAVRRGADGARGARSLRKRTVTRVAVVIPTRGRPRYLADAVRDVAREPLVDEIVVVEDGTRAVDAAAIAPARLLRLPHVGRSTARNRGVAATTAGAIAFLDADDVSRPARITRQLAALAAAPGAALA